MTKDKLYVLSAILLLIAVAIPLCMSYLGEEALKVVDSISDLIGAFCGVITLLIAILLYNKYGIDQSLFHYCGCHVVTDQCDVHTAFGQFIRGQTRSL